ncbi:hypothetical protein ACFL0X_00745 [Nanoarchaeota archaeon]
MKKLGIISVLILLSLGIVSACDCPNEHTLVAGKVYDQEGERVEGAFVEVICYNEPGSPSSVSKNTTTGGLGRYRVLFSQEDCSSGDTVIINVQKDGLYGSGQGIVDRNFEREFEIRGCLDVDIAVVNVPLVPEFGIVIGVLTVLSAMTLFFLIRK